MNLEILAGSLSMQGHFLKHPCEAADTLQFRAGPHNLLRLLSVAVGTRKNAYTHRPRPCSVSQLLSFCLKLAGECSASLRAINVSFPLGPYFFWLILRWLAHRIPALINQKGPWCWRLVISS